VLNKTAIALGVPHRLEQSLVGSADALVRAERLGDPVLLFWTALVRWFDLGRAAGDLAEMDRCLEIQRTVAEHHRQPVFQWTCQRLDAGHAPLAGDSDPAEQLAMEGLKTAEDGGRPGAVEKFFVHLLIVNLYRGPTRERIPSIQQLVDDLDRAPAAVAALAVVHAETGNADAARRVLADAAATGLDFPVDEDWIIAMTSFAWTAITCRGAQYAQPPFDDLNPFAALVAWDDGVPLGPVSGYLGGLATLLGRFDEAVAYFTQAVEMSHRFEAKFFTAIANL